MIDTKVWDMGATASDVQAFGSWTCSNYFTEYCHERTAKDVAMKEAKELKEKLKAMEGKLKAQKPLPKVKRILKNGDYMTVLWEDGDKTIVKRAEDEAESDYAAFTAALGIKCYGSNSALKRLVASAEVQGKKKKKQKEASPLKPIANKLSKICEVMAEANRGEKK